MPPSSPSVMQCFKLLCIKVQAAHELLLFVPSVRISAPVLSPVPRRRGCAPLSLFVVEVQKLEDSGEGE
jgi:hypothetical protein